MVPLCQAGAPAPSRDPPVKVAVQINGLRKRSVAFAAVRLPLQRCHGTPQPPPKPPPPRNHSRKGQQTKQGSTPQVPYRFLTGRNIQKNSSHLRRSLMPHQPFRHTGKTSPAAWITSRPLRSEAERSVDVAPPHAIVHCRSHSMFTGTH